MVLRLPEWIFRKSLWFGQKLGCEEATCSLVFPEEPEEVAELEEGVAYPGMKTESHSVKLGPKVTRKK